MAQLPIFKTQDQQHQMMQSQWKSKLDPMLANLLVQGLPINNISISSGHAQIINHKLGRQQQGWFITDQNAPARIARIAPLSATTLTLSSDATTTINIWVF